MAILIVQLEDRFAAGVFDKRVLIGRKPFNGVQLEHRSVSRIHAWIDKIDEGYRLNNASNRSGTFVNGQFVTNAGVILRDGDHIQAGLGKLVFRQDNAVPEGAVTFGISEKGTNPDFENHGILFHCQCSAPLWVPATMAGAYGKCAHCRGDIVIPGAPLTGIPQPLGPNDSIIDEPAIQEPIGSTERVEDPLEAPREVITPPRPRSKFPSAPRPKPASAKQTCSVCRTPIGPIDAITTCSACSQSYHTECWINNHGCAAYGCSQVGVLDLPENAATDSPSGKQPAATASAPGWGFALLLGSLLGSIFGVFTFGVPAMAVGGASAVLCARRSGIRAYIAGLATFICLLGVAVGVITSRFWWFGEPMWKWGR